VVGWVLVGLSIGSEFNVVNAFIGPEELDSISMGGEARAVFFWLCLLFFLLVILSILGFSFSFVSVFVGVFFVSVFSLIIFDLIFWFLCFIDFLVDLLSSASIVAVEKTCAWEVG
jgi:hypothetical protein